MNFATLKGLTIPEGKVTQITDASGRMLWSASKPFTAVVDFGAVTTGETPNTSGYYYKAITVTPAPAGWDACTHVTVNGEVYEVTRQEATLPNGIKNVKYTPAGDCKLLFIQCIGQLVCTLNFIELGTYAVQLGVLT